MGDPLRIVLPVPFNEAIRAADRRNVVLPDVYYGDLQGAARSQAFSVAGMSSITQLQQALDDMNEGLRSGMSFGEWQAKAADRGWDMPDHRLDLIMRMHTQTAYQAGHWEQFDRLSARRGYLMYSAINDTRTRPAHRAMDGVMKPVDDSFWNDHSPPCGYNCRCSLISLTADQVDARGGETRLISPDARADPGFGARPTMGGDVLDEQINGAMIGTHGTFQDSIRAWYDTVSQEKIIDRVQSFVTDYDTLAAEVRDFLVENDGIIAEHEAVAIRAYTGADYGLMNSFLRAKGGADPNLMATVASAVSGLAKLTRYDGIVLRGIEEARLADPAAFFAAHAEGEIVQYNGFTSGSYNNPFPGTVQYVIHSLTGRVVEALASDPFEAEVLFLPGTKFRVLSFTQGPVSRIELQELEDQSVAVPEDRQFSKLKISDTAVLRAESEVQAADPAAIARFRVDHDGMTPLEYALSRFPSAAMDVAQHAPHLLKKGPEGPSRS